MPLIPFNGIMPRIADSAFVAEGARIIGDVTIGPGSSVWYNVVIRADRSPVVIGSNTNVQDNSTVHADPGFPAIIGDGVTIGHNAVVHGCTVEDGALVGLHATVLNGAVIGSQSIVGANALVPEKKTIPPRSLAVGVPAKVVRELSEEDAQGLARTAGNYAALAQEHKASR